MALKIPLFKIYSDENDTEAINRIIKSGMNWAIGSEVSEFEKKIAQYIGTSHCVVFNSGTSALHAIMSAHDIKNGDEVIVPSFSFIATANAPLFVQGKPIFADIEETSLGLDPEDVKEKITEKTKVILPVHYAGCPAQIRALKELAEDHDLLLIEDAAESFGAKLENQMTGSFGHSAMLSFCQNKVITTGEGGAIVTDSKEVYDKLMLIRSHGRKDDKDYFTDAFSSNYINLGYNLRLSNILAALGLAQLEKVESIISKRLKVANYYFEKLKSVDGLVLPFIPPSGRHVFQLFSVRVKHGFRAELVDFLKSNGISSKVYFFPIHSTFFYKDLLKYNVHLPVTESISQEILSLPIYPTMTEEEQNYVIEKINEFYEAKF
ncbi:MAG: DegT/DnrJ/EryC1/StrS family aminotransferase [Candidatus Hodarchaeales archaeon]|jgi:perosamine synthetase